MPRNVFLYEDCNFDAIQMYKVVCVVRILSFIRIFLQKKSCLLSFQKILVGTKQ